MKLFILGFICALLIGGWVTLAVVGVISVKVAILVPVCLLGGIVIATFIFANLFSL